MQNNIKHIVRLAQQQALASFADLVGHMLMDSNVLISNAVRNAPAADHAALNAARYWLGEKDRLFRQIMLAKFTTLLERAMETMHTDLRAGLHDIRADTLSLVDDEVMTRQIELDRLAVRLRDVDELSLGRINLTIASLHGVSKVRERENPFRPYLLARALYESVRETARDTPMAKVLFEHMSAAMANRLPAYYAAILGNFEARGLDARLLAQPSDMTRAQRERMNAEYTSGAANQMQGLQELVWQVLDERGAAPRGTPSGHGAAARPAAPASPQRSWLNAHLRQLQQGPGDAAAAALAPSPLALSEQLAEKADPHSRVTIDLVGLAFDYIARDELLQRDMRNVLLRLHVPFLRAAVLDPQMLQEHNHPARSLLDRLGTLAATMQNAGASLPALQGQASRLIEQVRQQFDADTAVFAAAERELDAIVDTLLQRSAPQYAALRAAIEVADVDGAQSLAAHKTLAALLAPLRLDARLRAFIDTVWIRVMQRPGGGLDATLLPELIWSSQEKAAAEDRSVLMRALPTLVRRIREGIAQLGLPPAEANGALDQLVAIHMDVLGQRIAAGGLSTGLDWLHVHFAPLSMGAAVAPAGASAPAAADVLAPAALQAALAQQGLAAVVQGEPAWRDSLASDQEWLQRARPGASFETLIDGRFVAAGLQAVSADLGIFVFSPPAPAVPLVYRKHALLAAIDAGTIRPLEYAPLFERAVSAAMTGLTTPPG
ncbi:DUF1631 family protein [Massilia sp. PWRC2]|uniref:DUF1631 family protein n=1 Tax=Massilia sp. PWRC2 TaxID=2804626 RepID=UPI003CEDC0BB